MMWKTKKYAQSSALPAIAAALVLSSTPAWSQEVTPPAEPDPVVIDAPPPVVESTPVTTDSTITTDTTAVPTKATEAAPVAAKPKAKATRTTAAKKPTATRVASAAAPAAASVATPAPEATPAPQQPIVDARPQAEQAAMPPEETRPALNVDEDALMLGGGALALLALGGGAVAFARRRRHQDEEVIEETAADQPMTIEPEPQPTPRHDAIYEVQPAIVAPSAFAWGNPQPAESNVENRDDETWVERAYRGPTPDNPSLSLRKRLKRANFFDARERRVAAGKAEPIEADAGLPEHVADDARERELELA